MTTTPKVAVLGGGMSGICMGIKLKEAGFHDFTIYEKADKVGGTWRDNTYPGVACDVPSHLYSFSFAQNPDWSEAFSCGEEIQDYCEDVSARYDILEHAQFHKEVTAAAYQNGQWHLRFADGSEAHADVVVSALGGLHHPFWPDIPGREEFQGESLHSAMWREGIDLKDKNVVVIGSAASAVQIIPQIASQVKSLAVFQRTPNWIFPRMNIKYSRAMRWLYRYVPGLLQLKRALLYFRAEIILFPLFRENSFMQRRFRKLAVQHIEDIVQDKTLAKKLIPDYPVGCKRILFIDEYLESLQLPHVTLENEAATRIDADGVVGANGAKHKADVIIYATGFKPFQFLDQFDVTGVGGKNLAEHWKDTVESHRTVAISGFPNFFMLLGPNSGLGHNSIILMIEAQVRYIVGCLQALRQRKLAWLNPKAEDERRFNDGLKAGFKGSVWIGGCKSWYKETDGRIHTLWPWSVMRYRREMAHPNLKEYRTDSNTLDAAE